VNEILKGKGWTKIQLWGEKSEKFWLLLSINLEFLNNRNDKAKNFQAKKKGSRGVRIGGVFDKQGGGLGKQQRTEKVDCYPSGRNKGKMGHGHPSGGGRSGKERVTEGKLKVNTRAQIVGGRKRKERTRIQV